MQVISVPEVVITQLKLSVVAALVFGAPWMLWQMWKFISPGLYQHAREVARGGTQHGHGETGADAQRQTDEMQKKD